MMDEFNGLIAGIKAVGKSGGYSLLKIVLLVDDRGNPVYYPSIQYKRLSPRLKAKQRLNEILTSFMDSETPIEWSTQELNPNQSGKNNDET